MCMKSCSSCSDESCIFLVVTFLKAVEWKNVTTKVTHHLLPNFYFGKREKNVTTNQNGEVVSPTLSFRL